MKKIPGFSFTQDAMKVGLGEHVEHLRRFSKDKEGYHHRYGGVATESVEEKLLPKMYGLQVDPGTVLQGRFTARPIGEKQIIASAVAFLLPNGECEVAYAVEKPYRKRGIGSELVRRTIRWAWRVPQVRTLVAYCDGDNTEMLALLRKNGFTSRKLVAGDVFESQVTLELSVHEPSAALNPFVALGCVVLKVCDIFLELLLDAPDIAEKVLAKNADAMVSTYRFWSGATD